MATYITLMNWTDQGIRNFKETAERAKAASAAVEAMGGKVKGMYWTIGPYDVVAVGEFPDEETGMAFLLTLGSQGNLRTTTLRAFDADEIQAVIAKTG
jgi:uncharacterized protein with GYD domain